MRNEMQFIYTSDTLSVNFSLKKKCLESNLESLRNN